MVSRCLHQALVEGDSLSAFSLPVHRRSIYSIPCGEYLKERWPAEGVPKVWYPVV
jgi:hypothetical protein